MWGTVLRFVAFVLEKAWSVGVRVAVAVANWAKAHYQDVYRWIVEGIAWDTIIKWIRKRLGI